MLQGKNPPRNSRDKGTFFSTINMPGPEQMATDIMLLEKTMMDSDVSLAIRFYNWKGLWLSIGKNQKYLPRNWQKLIINRKLQIVRRPSGGSAVLHGSGLTYALIWLSPPRKKLEAYYLASQWLIKGFSELGLPLQFGDQPTNSYETDCFATSTAADLIDSDGQKRIGSAQVWRKGHLLQHGEIILDPPSQLWMEVFKTKAPTPAPSSIPREGLDKFLRKTCISYWPEISWQYDEFNQKELERISVSAEQYVLHSN